MSKEEFLNLVYVAYNSAIKAKRESKQKLEYFSKLNINNEESEKSKKIYEVANLNIGRLKEILRLPLYEKVNNLTTLELENYKMELCKEGKEALASSQQQLEIFLSEKEKLVLELEDNYKAFSSELDNAKKEVLVDEGKVIQAKISDVDKNIVDERERINKIKTYLSELEIKNKNDIREDLIVKLDLLKLRENEEIKFIRSDVVVKVANNNGDVETLLQLLQEYRNEKNKVISYNLTLPSFDVAYQLDYLNKEKQMIDGVDLTIDSFSDIYNLNSLLNSQIERLNRYNKYLKRDYIPLFINSQFTLDTIKNINDLDINTFIIKINAIKEKFPKLPIKVLNNLSSLSEMNTFIGRSFKGKKIKEYKSNIIESIYEFIFSLLEEELRKLSNCLKHINFEKNIGENEVFNSEYLIDCTKNINIDNCFEIVSQVNANIVAVSEKYQQLTNELTELKTEADKNNADLKPKLNVRENKLDELNTKINVIIGSKLQSSDLDYLLNTYSSEDLIENLANVEFLQLINSIKSNASSQKIEVNDLYEYNNNNFVFTEEELEGPKKV